MDFVTLSNGVKMPVLGFGVFQIDAKETVEYCRTCKIGAGGTYGRKYCSIRFPFK